MLDINGLGTEQRNDKTKDLDLMSTMEIIQIMNEEDLNVVAGVKKALPQIEKVVGVMQETLKNGWSCYIFQLDSTMHWSGVSGFA